MEKYKLELDNGDIYIYQSYREAALAAFELAAKYDLALYKWGDSSIIWGKDWLLIGTIPDDMWCPESSQVPGIKHPDTGKLYG